MDRKLMDPIEWVLNLPDRYFGAKTPVRRAAAVLFLPAALPVYLVLFLSCAATIFIMALWFYIKEGQ